MMKQLLGNTLSQAADVLGPLCVDIAILAPRHVVLVVMQGPGPLSFLLNKRAINVYILIRALVGQGFMPRQQGPSESQVLELRKRPPHLATSHPTYGRALW